MDRVECCPIFVHLPLLGIGNTSDVGSSYQGLGIVGSGEWDALHCSRKQGPAVLGGLRIERTKRGGCRDAFRVHCCPARRDPSPIEGSDWKTKSPATDPSRAELSSGLPIFLDQLIDTLRAKLGPGSHSPGMKRGATQHVRVLLARGSAVAQVVHDYGGVCQAITGLAVELGALISAEEFQVLNGFLDDAIADAVTEFSAARDDAAVPREVERLGVLGHEMRNLLSSATLSYQPVVNGSVGIGGSTGAILGRSLRGMGVLLNRSLAEVRLSSGLYRAEPLLLAEVLEEVEVAAALDARARGLELTFLSTHYGIVVEADRQLLIAALSNLIQNAFKFTRAQGLVSLTTSMGGGRSRSRWRTSAAVFPLERPRRCSSHSSRVAETGLALDSGSPSVARASVCSGATCRCATFQARVASSR